MLRSPFFIVGNYRSGTTMLRLMITSHPRLCVPPETGFSVLLSWMMISRSIDKTYYQEFASRIQHLDNWEDFGVSSEELYMELCNLKPSTFSDCVDVMYRLYMKKHDPEASRWGDKTTWYVDWVPEIYQQFPQAKFIHLIRDERDVLCSYRGTPHLTRSAAKVALQWATNVGSIKKAARKIPSENYFEVRYEALVRQPETELKKICEFLNEEYTPRILEFWQANRERKLEPDRHIGWKKLTKQPVTTESVANCKPSTYTDNMLKICERLVKKK